MCLRVLPGLLGVVCRLQHQRGGRGQQGRQVGRASPRGDRRRLLSLMETVQDSRMMCFVAPCSVQTPLHEFISTVQSWHVDTPVHRGVFSTLTAASVVEISHWLRKVRCPEAAVSCFGHEEAVFFLAACSCLSLAIFQSLGTAEVRLLP